MNVLFKKLKPLFWFCYSEKVLFLGKGLYSNVKVTKRDSRISLFTGENNYLQTSINSDVKPYGTHLDWYLIAPWFSSNFNKKIPALLILGLGGGAQVKSYNSYYDVNKITAVEIDPLIIDLGKKYFDLNTKNLKTINCDAYAYIETVKEKYNIIILDIFKENVFDSSKNLSVFLSNISNHLTTEGVLFINKLRSDPANNSLGNDLKKDFDTLITLDINFTKFFIATNSPTAPKSQKEITNLLETASTKTSDFKFFRKLKTSSINVL